MRLSTIKPFFFYFAHLKIVWIFKNLLSSITFKFVRVHPAYNEDCIHNSFENLKVQVSNSMAVCVTSTCREKPDMPH